METKTCKTCAHWSDQAPYGRPREFAVRECSMVRMQVVFFDMRDDSYIDPHRGGGLFTGPAFGCTHYEEAPVREEPPPPERLRCCSRCGKDKPASAFKRVSSGKSTGSKCRECCNELSRESSKRQEEARRARKAAAEAHWGVPDDVPAKSWRGKSYEECGWVFTKVDNGNQDVQ